MAIRTGEPVRLRPPPERENEDELRLQFAAPMEIEREKAREVARHRRLRPAGTASERERRSPGSRLPAPGGQQRRQCPTNLRVSNLPSGPTTG